LNIRDDFEELSFKLWADVVVPFDERHEEESGNGCVDLIRKEQVYVNYHQVHLVNLVSVRLNISFSVLIVVIVDFDWLAGRLIAFSLPYQT